MNTSLTYIAAITAALTLSALAAACGDDETSAQTPGVTGAGATASGAGRTSTSAGKSGSATAGNTVASAGRSGGSGTSAGHSGSASSAGAMADDDAGVMTPVAGATAGHAGSSAAGSGGSKAGSGGNAAAGSGGGAAATFTQVYAVFKASCAGATCHVQSTNPGDRLSFADQATAYMNLVGVNSVTCSGEKRVVAGDPTKSELLYTLNRTNIGNCSRTPKMPDNRAKLSQSDIDLVTSWVQGGAQNN